MSEPIYYDAAGRPYAVRDGVSVWLSSQPASPAASLVYAGFWRRLAARLIDFMLTAVLAAIGGVVVALVGALITGILGRSYDEFVSGMQTTSALGYGLSFLATLSYEVAAEGIHGSTPGKMMLGMTVRSVDLGYCSVIQALKRSIAVVVDGLFFGIVGYASMSQSPHRQRYGDRWARTVVVRTRSLTEAQRRSGLRFAGATLAAISSYSVIAVLSLIN